MEECFIGLKDGVVSCHQAGTVRTDRKILRKSWKSNPKTGRVFCIEMYDIGFTGRTRGWMVEGCLVYFIMAPVGLIFGILLSIAYILHPVEVRQILCCGSCCVYYLFLSIYAEKLT